MTETILAQSDAAGGLGRARWTPWLVVAAWMGGVLVAFWFFELRAQGSFKNAVFGLTASDIRVQGVESWFASNIRPSSAIAPVGATIVHFYQAGCACNRAIEPRLADIEKRYRTRGVSVVRVERAALAPSTNLDWIDATPAALVFNGSGRLVYFGPYGDAAWCGASGDPVERALEQSLRGTPQRLQKITARGCFCGSLPIETQGTIS